MDFVSLDAGSEWTSRNTALILIGEGKLADARRNAQRLSNTPIVSRDLFQACLDPSPSFELGRVAEKTEAAVLFGADSEPRYYYGALLSYCGQDNAALRLLRSAIGQNYCSYTALQTDPLLVKLRRTPEFSELLSAAKECQSRFLAAAARLGFAFERRSP
jgi:hypothetical protein